MITAKQGTVVHFVANVNGGVWSVAKTLAAHHRPRWRVLLVAMYRGQLRPSHAAEAEEYFDAAHLVRRPSVTGIYYLAPVRVAAAIQALGVDAGADNVVYHFHTGPYTPCVYRLPRGRRAGKWLACFHGSRGNFRDVTNYAKRALNIVGVRSLLRKRVTLVAVSNRSAWDLAQLYGCRQEDFRVIHNGTEPQNNAQRATHADEGRPFRVGFLGTVTPTKGWRKVVTAVQQLRREGMNVTCNIVGDGSDFPELQRLAAQHAEWLDAPGHVVQPEKHALPSMDVLVLPSDYEGHPEVILEAMSGGVPCICSDVGGCAETVRQEQEGYILRENTAEEIAKRIKTIINTDGMWLKMSRNCVARHQEMFTAEKMAASWEHLYLKAN